MPAGQIAVIVPTYNERENIAVLYQRVSACLVGIPFEFIVVDDSSPDGTAEVAHGLARRFDNVRCLRRIGRRGLASAVIEGILASSAPYAAVVDADLQHDETILPEMLRRLQSGAAIVVGTRYGADGSIGDGLSPLRSGGSRAATWLAGMVAGVAVSDPLSGFFAVRRDVFDSVAARLSPDGFKVLFDLLVTAGRQASRRGQRLRVDEVAYVFRARHSGDSKMGLLVAAQFTGLLVSQLSRGIVPPTFLLFALVGGIGVVVHLAALWLVVSLTDVGFSVAQFLATLVAMTSNFVLNNSLTYADRRLRGGRFFSGLLSFYAACSIGVLANVSVATLAYGASPNVFVAGIAGALMSAVFNYAVTRAITWR